MTKSISIRSLIVEKAEEGDNPDPISLIDPIVDSIPDEDLREYLKDALRIGGVYTILANYRRNHLNSAMQSKDVTVAPKKPSKSSPAVFSAKHAMVKNEWEELLKTSIPTENGWKILRDATLVDISYQAQRRREQVDKLEAEAQKWDKVRTIMNFHGVARFGDLPENALREVHNLQAA